MYSLKRLLPINPTAASATTIQSIRLLSTRATGDDEWNDAWESAWLPDDVSAQHRAPWETDVSLPSASASPATADLDDDTKAFVAEMDERWTERRAAKTLQRAPEQHQKAVGSRKSGNDYRVRKQKIHASLWAKEIEKMEESRLGGPGAADDIDRLLDSCSEIFDVGNFEVSNSSGLKTKPDGWETTCKSEEGNIWDMSQKEEDILLQEFERRIAFSKFQIASFIKTHIFSRRRPIDGWKYMIEEIGPNARKGKGSVQRVPALADPATQPFWEEKTNSTPFKGKR